MFACGVLMAVLQAQAQAQTQAVTPVDEALRQVEQLQRELRDRLDQERAESTRKRLTTPPAAAAPEPAAAASVDGPCVKVASVKLDGAEQFLLTTQAALTAPFHDRCLNQRDLNDLLERVTRHYVDAGFITARVYVPRQKMQEGVLRLTVVEGRVASLSESHEDQGTGDAINLTTAFPGVVGKPLNLRDLEQGIDQINRLSSNNATLEIKPGAQAGDSDVVIRNAPSSRLHPMFALSSHGGKATGKALMNLGLGVDNPLGLNDKLVLQHTTTVSNPYRLRHSAANTVVYAVPMGPVTLVGTHLWSDYVTRVYPVGGELEMKGTFKSRSAGMDVMAFRDRNNRLSFNGTLGVKAVNTFVADQFLSVSSRTLATLDLGVAWVTKVDGGAVSASLNQVRGLPGFGALRDHPELAIDSPQAQYRKWQAELSWVKPIASEHGEILFTSAWRGQASRDVLYGSEQIALSGVSNVRAFRETNVAGDTGYIWRNELSQSRRLEVGPAAVTVKPFAAFDMGWIRPRYSQEGGKLTSVAIGVRATSGPVSAELFATHPVKQPERFAAEAGQIFLKLGLSF